MIRIFISTDIHNFPLEEALQSISPARREKALKFKHEQGQRECVLAYLLLKQGLKEMYGIDGNPEILEEEGGKPFLRFHADIHFNFSHCKQAVICAIGDEPVGVDIETIREYKESLARHVLNAEELAIVESSDNPAREFISFWTKKEAVLKLTGQGIREDLKTVLPAEDIELQTTITDNFIYTIATWK